MVPTWGFMIWLRKKSKWVVGYVEETLPSTQAESSTLALNQNAAAFIERFLADADIAPTTKETYRKSLRQFFIWYQTQNLEGLTRTDILAYKQSQLGKIQANTVGSYLSALRSFFRWLEAEKLFPNVAAGVKGTKLSQGHRKDALTPSQVNLVLNALRGAGEDEFAKRDYALFNLLVRTGLRTIEIHRADIGDIRNKGMQTVLYIQGKGRQHKDEFVVLTDATLRPIYEYLATRERRGKDEPLFASLSTRTFGGRLSVRSIRGIVKRSLRASGIDSDRITTHSLRHSAVTMALLGGASLQQAQALARHSNINTTLIYSHNLDRINHAAEFMIDDIIDGG